MAGSALILHAAVGSATVAAMMGATAAIVALLRRSILTSAREMHLHLPWFRRHWLHDRDRFLFWLVKRYCGATLNETFKYIRRYAFMRICRCGWLPLSSGSRKETYYGKHTKLIARYRAVEGIWSPSKKPAGRPGAAPTLAGLPA